MTNHEIIEAVLAEDASRDLRNGIDTGRFHVTDANVALHASGGALISIIHLIVRGEDRDALMRAIDFMTDY